MENVLPEQAANYDRHCDNAAIGQNVWQRHWVGARPHRPLRGNMGRNMRRTMRRGMSGAVSRGAGRRGIHRQFMGQSFRATLAHNSAAEGPPTEPQAHRLCVYGDGGRQMTSTRPVMEK